MRTHKAIAVNSGVLPVMLAALILIEPARAQFRDPRETAAVAEMRTLAEALQQCAIETTYFVSLETLNDSAFSQTEPPWDYLNQNGGTFVIRPARGVFDAQRKNLLAGFNDWPGPLVNFQQGQTQEGVTPYDRGSPLDPWGTPYYFFTPLGLARGDAGAVTLELYGDAFDTYTIVSLGSDGVIGGGDDLSYSLGVSVSALAVSRLEGEGVQQSAGPQRTVRLSQAVTQFIAPVESAAAVIGYNLGATRGEGDVLFNGEPMVSIKSWSNRRIEFTLPASPLGTGELVVRRGGALSNPLRLQLVAPQAASPHWELYR